jgi:HNH endonuclease
MEHIQPRSSGGSDLPDNLAVACYRCNEFKGSKVNLIDSVTYISLPPGLYGLRLVGILPINYRLLKNIDLSFPIEQVYRGLVLIPEPE